MGLPISQLLSGLDVRIKTRVGVENKTQEYGENCDKEVLRKDPRPGYQNLQKYQQVGHCVVC